MKNGIEDRLSPLSSDKINFSETIIKELNPEAIQNKKVVSNPQKERLTKDVRYQEYSEVTLACIKRIDHKIWQPRVTSFCGQWPLTMRDCFLVCRPAPMGGQPGSVPFRNPRWGIFCGESPLTMRDCFLVDSVRYIFASVPKGALFFCPLSTQSLGCLRTNNEGVHP